MERIFNLLRIFFHHPWTTLIMVSLFLVMAARADAFQVGGLEFQDSYRHAPKEGELPLRGAGLKRFLSIRVVAVGLYLPEGAQEKEVLTDIPKSLEVVYLQNIPGPELQHATTKGIRLNVTPEEFKKLEKRIEQINSYYPNVQKMDRIRVTYLPGKGTTVEFNDIVKGTVPGEDFGRAFFSIWVGQRPVDPRMKVILLGKSKQRADEIRD